MAKQKTTCEWCGLHKKDKNKFCGKVCQYSFDSFRQTDEYTAFRVMYKQAKLRSIKSNYEFTITLKDIKDVWEAQQEICVYSGEKLKFGESRRDKDTRGNTTASLDRRDSLQGYIPSNIQIVHVKVNLMKHVLPEREFIEWCEKVTSYANGNRFDRVA